MTKRFILQGILTPIIFELCGIIPLIFALFGIINITAAVRLRNLLVYQYYYIFLIIAAGFFVFSVYIFLKMKHKCNMLGLIRYRNTIVIAFMALILTELILLVIIQYAEQIIYGRFLISITDFIPIGIALGIILMSFIIASSIISSKYLRKSRNMIPKR